MALLLQGRVDHGAAFLLPDLRQKKIKASLTIHTFMSWQKDQIISVGKKEKKKKKEKNPTKNSELGSKNCLYLHAAAM